MGVMRGAGAAKTGSFLMRLGSELEEEEEEEEEDNLAETDGRKCSLEARLEEDWAGETEVKHQLLIVMLDIVQPSLRFSPFIYKLHHY